jgi:hypothetical protein
MENKDDDDDDDDDEHYVTSFIAITHSFVFTVICTLLFDFVLLSSFGVPIYFLFYKLNSLHHVTSQKTRYLKCNFVYPP